MSLEKQFVKLCLNGNLNEAKEFYKTIEPENEEIINSSPNGRINLEKYKHEDFSSRIEKILAFKNTTPAMSEFEVLYQEIKSFFDLKSTPNLHYSNDHSSRFYLISLYLCVSKISKKEKNISSYVLSTKQEIKNFLQIFAYNVMHESGKDDIEHYFVVITKEDINTPVLKQFFDMYIQEYPLLDVSKQTREFIHSTKELNGKPSEGKLGVVNSD